MRFHRTARYLADETYRRRIARQLNKGENLHSLRRELAYATSSRPSRCGA
jgi:TnpA family transposase